MEPLTALSFVFFTALVGVLTFLLTRGDDHATTTGYFLGGRTLTGGVIAGSLLLTNLNAEQLVGLNGLAFKQGLSVMAWEVFSALTMLLMALFFLPRFLKSGIVTIPQFFEERYGRSTRVIGTVIFIIAYAVVLLPIVLYAGAKGLNAMLDLKSVTGIGPGTGQLWFTVWLVGIIGSIYAIFGGLRTVAVSDTINGIGLLVGGFLITFFALSAVGDGRGAWAGMQTLLEKHPERFNSIGGPTDDVPFFTLFSGATLIMMFYWCTNQQIIQRALAARSLKEGQKGVLLAAFFKVIAPLVLVLPGIAAYHLYATSGTVNPDDAFGVMVKSTLPPYLTGFIAAVLVGAILSSFNSVLNSTATLFSLGVYRDLAGGEVTEKQVILSGKVCGAVVAVVAMSIAPLLGQNDTIFSYLQMVNAIYFIPLLAVVLVGLFTSRVPAVAANTVMLTGVLILTLKSTVFSDVVDSVMHNFHFVGLTFVVLVAAMLIMGAVRPRRTPYVQRDSGEVDLEPWRHAKVVAAALALSVLGIYVAFADFSVL